MTLSHQFRKRLAYLNLVLLLLCLLLGWRYGKILHQYRIVLSVNDVMQNAGQVSFLIQNMSAADSVLHIGDMLGHNVNLSRFVLKKISLAQKSSSRNIYLFHSPSLDRAGSTATPLTHEAFLHSMSNENGVVFIDNFCVADWQEVKEKRIYEKTSLTPGPYCFSEQESLAVDNLIKQYEVKQVIVYYDSPVYLKLIETFLIYLREKNMAISFIKIKS